MSGACAVFVEITRESLAWTLLLMVVGVLLGFFVRRIGEGSMGASIARLTKENEELKCEVSRLQTAFDSVLGENRRLQREIDKLKQQLSDLDKIVQINRHDADDWREIAARGKTT